jgi:glycosyltransferase involved in cell wall biosynthesis
MAPLFSLITASFNCAGTIGRTLASVRAQTLRDFEYLVIDGGSTDGTLDLVRAAGDVVETLVSEKDRGISDAFNKGLALARGRYVGFVNADDWYEPSALAAVARELELEQRPADVYCGLQRYWKGEKQGATFDVDPALLPSFMSVNHIASFARRMVFVEHGGFKLEYHAAMDYELYLRFFHRGARFQRVPAVLANMSLGGVSDRRWREGLLEVRRAQLENGVGLTAANWNFLFQLGKGSVRRWLEESGAPGLVALYRERLGRVRKSKAR